MKSKRYLTTHEIDKLKEKDFASRLKQANLTSKNFITVFVKNVYFDDKLKKLNKNITLNKTRNVEFKNKQDDLPKKIKLISINRLTEDLINKYSILHGAKYFSSDGLQNYLVFVSARHVGFHTNHGKVRGNVQECQKKVLKTHILQTLVLLQS